jgi:hypothetical protein
MPPKGSTKGKGPKGKGPAVYFASQKLVRLLYNLLECEIFEVPGSWWRSQINGAARTVMSIAQCMSVDEHWRPGGAVSASKLSFEVGMAMIDGPFFLWDLVEGTDYWWVDLRKMSEAYLPRLERIKEAKRAAEEEATDLIRDLDFITFIAGHTYRPRSDLPT